MFYLKVTTGL